MKLEVHGIYQVELCSGEQRRWEYLGPDRRAVVWWRDLATARVFAESSLMYAWQVVEKTP